MKTKMTIGEKIEYEVRKQEFSITEFARLINCKRNNVYNIFKRNTIDIELLAKISKVLSYNFFADLAKDYSLADTPQVESEQDEYNRKAVNQFMDVVPKILKELGKETTIGFGSKEEFDEPMPDFSLPSYCITFTIGSTWTEKSNTVSGSVFDVQQISDGDKFSFNSIVSKPYGSRIIDIKLDYKSYDEWKELLTFVFQKFPNLRFRRHLETNYINPILIN